MPYGLLFYPPEFRVVIDANIELGRVITDFTQQQLEQIRLLLASQPAHAGESSPKGFLLRYIFFEAATKAIDKYCRESLGHLRQVWRFAGKGKGYYRRAK